MRLVAAAGLLVVASFTTSGCTLWEDGENVVGQLSEGYVANTVLTELLDDVRELDDVESAEAGLNVLYRTVGVVVQLRDSAPASIIADVALKVDETMRRTELQPYKREFTVHAGGAGIRQQFFDRAPVDYAAELEYWHVVQSALGPDIVLSLGNDRAGANQRILSTQEDAAVATIAEHYDVLAALEPPNEVETMWRMPGIVGYADWLGPLPERSVVTLMAEMATVTNLLDDSVPEMPPGFFVALSNDRDAHPPRFTLITNMPGAETDAAAAWPLVLTMVRGALGTGLTEFQVGVQSWDGDEFESANFHRGDCAEVHPPSQADRKLVADVEAQGIAIPEVAAGICLVFAGT